MSVQVRLMQREDVPAMLNIQAKCYPPSMNESAQALTARHECCGDTAWVAVDATGAVGAYLVAYRSRRGKVSCLGDAFAHEPQADVLYLHDLAIATEWRGRGLARVLLDHARQQALAQGLSGLSLVSVNDTVPFWRQQGFEPVADLSEAALAALATYDGPAVYLCA